ncbi:hypothetical protein IVB12_15245 [Bradyrhizobium sp. 179]|uniref:hypothetical protein n=1 Tax=Bradyrhizobium sp. 179 TaxID=2782648 RepID=UPI001FF95FEA|nr:hypothetical protein [Bradyrhizobium sp. 179]MCK1543270.1 hypothetical protein [Bradyrhizobium sp. 179]
MMLLVLPMTLLLTACDGTNSEVVVRVVCPTINQYDAKTQERALAEYNALPAGSALRLFIGDYKRLRDQIRICRARSK